ncbi:aspartyl protease family protein At5g10770 [Ziziphus jujuba]|nr:aspartyl protease family protein At5g10770 [Ziziphus jujuba]
MFNGFLFGCGHENRGLFGQTAGLLGLGRDKMSIVQQTSKIYRRIFSYCLPTPFSGSTGSLTFDRTPVSSKDIKYTPLSTSTGINDSFYALDLEGIIVAGAKLSIPSSIFSSPGTIIDSGTVITRLPATAYSASWSAFREGMSGYQTAPALSILETCYDLSMYPSFCFPKISFLFGGGVEVELKFEDIIYVGGNARQFCLALAGYTDDDEVTIFGNVQQQSLEVVYDVGGGRIGFWPCCLLSYLTFTAK